MSQEEIRNEITTLIRLAAITVPDDRLPALVMGLAATRVTATALARYDYGLVEIAARFTPPDSQGKGPSPRRESER